LSAARDIWNIAICMYTHFPKLQ